MSPSDDAAQPQPPIKRAFRRPLVLIVFAAIVVAGTAADLWSKQYVFESMLAEPWVAGKVRQVDRGLPPDDVLRGVGIHRQALGPVSFTLSTNKGVVFGLPLPRELAVATTGLTIVLVLVFFLLSDGRQWAIHIALALILAGALGNLYDRGWGSVVLPGMDDQPIRYQVRDFIDCSKCLMYDGRSLYPYIFNVADVLLVIGVLIPLGYWIVQRPVRRSPASGPAKTRKSPRPEHS